ncbi:hypothetical protein AD952_09215 [Acetobacter cerevisiae]|uniref:Uncharacterized protein n=1 Tax=Acetobacter cerevisiae TaxID=178900 RepID=A0A149UU67_9PROT|nr:hypothetical protein AD952_09215 [Acetobacter cerevisiae]
MRTRDEQIIGCAQYLIRMRNDCKSTEYDLVECIIHEAEQRVRAEIGRDSERLDWLEQKFRSCTVYMNGEQMFMPGPKVRNLKGRDFREAIDKARENAND